MHFCHTLRLPPSPPPLWWASQIHRVRVSYIYLLGTSTSEHVSTFALLNDINIGWALLQLLLKYYVQYLPIDLLYWYVRAQCSMTVGYFKFCPMVRNISVLSRWLLLGSWHACLAVCAVHIFVFVFSIAGGICDMVWMEMVRGSGGWWGHEIRSHHGTAGIQFRKSARRMK
jgi:hypothetical protein